jgi:hypothetical protein
MEIPQLDTNKDYFRNNTMAGSSTNKIQAVADQQDLHNLIMTYCRAIDRRDPKLLATVYHPDAIEDRGDIFKGTASEFIEWVGKDAPNYDITIHRIFNTLFKVDGDVAEGEIYCDAYHRTSGENSMEITVGGRYLDRYEKRNGQWKIVYRTSTMDRCTMTPTNQDAYNQFVAGCSIGEGGSGDLSYKVLTLFKRLDS